MNTRFLLLSLIAVALHSAAEDHQVLVSNFSFTPSSLTIQAGDTVTWTNQQGTHNVQADDDSFRCANGCDGDGEGGSGDPASNEWSFTLTFEEPDDLIRYFCELHGGIGGVGMSGTITVEEPKQVDDIFDDRFELSL